MNKSFILFSIVFPIFILFFFNCSTDSLYSKDEYMNLGKSNNASTTANVTGTRSATVIIASSDSQSTTGVDLVISTSDDAGIAINAQIAKLNSLTGGTILLMEGTYNISTNILPLSNVNIVGQGTGTILRRNSSSLVQVIYVASSVSNVAFSYFLIDGNGSNYEAYKSYGINCQVNTNTGISYDHVQSNNNKGSFAYGFYNCTYLTNCIGNNNSGMCYCYGFASCTQLLYCSGNNNIGLIMPVMDVGVTGNIGYGYGFSACTRMQQNTGTGNKTALFDSTCYADIGSTPVAMTAAGGYNG